MDAMTQIAASPIPPPPIIWMTPEAFTLWRHTHHLSKREAAAALGIARNTLRAYETGRYRIPRYIALACEALTSRRMAA